MKRRYEKVIERCQDCPEYNANVAYIACDKRDLTRRWSEGFIEDVRTHWFETCDLPEVKDEGAQS